MGYRMRALIASEARCKALAAIHTHPAKLRDVDHGTYRISEPDTPSPYPYDPSATPAVIFDIDGTLVNVEHRQMIFEDGKLKGKAKWNAFYEAAKDDTPNQPIIDMTQLYWDTGWYVALFTGRPEKYRKATREQLLRFGVRYSSLHMRPDVRGSAIPDVELKKDMLWELDRRVHFVVEDRDRVVAMWRSLGITCLQCNYGDF